MSALDPSAPGLPIVSSGGGASLPTTPAEALLDASATDTMVGLDGSGVGQALSASAARTRMGLGGAAVLDVGTTAGTVAAGNDSRFSAGAYTINWQGTGVTATSGNGTATVTSASVVTCSLGPAALSTYYNPTYTSPRVAAAIQSSWGIDPRRFVFRARLSSSTGRNSTSLAWASIENGAAKYDIYLWGTTVGVENVGAGSAIASGTPSPAIGWGGTDWIELRLNGSQYVASFGRGTGGALPVAGGWQQVSATTITLAAMSTDFTSVGLDAGQTTPAAGGSGVSMVWTDATITGIS